MFTLSFRVLHSHSFTSNNLSLQLLIDAVGPSPSIIYKLLSPLSYLRQSDLSFIAATSTTAFRSQRSYFLCAKKKKKITSLPGPVFFFFLHLLLCHSCQRTQLCNLSGRLERKPDVGSTPIAIKAVLPTAHLAIPLSQKQAIHFRDELWDHLAKSK